MSDHQIERLAYPAVAVGAIAALFMWLAIGTPRMHAPAHPQAPTPSPSAIQVGPPAEPAEPTLTEIGDWADVG